MYSGSISQRDFQGRPRTGLESRGGVRLEGQFPTIDALCGIRREGDQLDIEIIAGGCIDVQVEVGHFSGVNHGVQKLDAHESEVGIHLGIVAGDHKVLDLGGVPIGVPGIHIHIIIDVAEH